MATVDPFLNSHFGTEDSMELSNDPSQGLDADEDIDITLDAVDPQPTDNMDEEMTGEFETPSANKADQDQHGPEDELMLADFVSESLDDAHIDYDVETQDVEADDTEGVSSLKATVGATHASRSDEAVSKGEDEGTEAVDSISATLPPTIGDAFPTDIGTSSQALRDKDTKVESNFEERISVSSPRKEIHDSISNDSRSHHPQIGSKAALDAVGPEIASDDDKESLIDPQETDVLKDHGRGDGKHEQDPEDAARIGEQVDIFNGTDLGSGLQRTNTLHPIVVVYLDTEMSLFPPLAHDTSNLSTFLLQDESLAYGSIQKMLHALREVLEDGVGETDEVEMAIEELSLRFCQSNGNLSTITFSQIVETYVRLQKNDKVTETPPLYAHLYTVTNTAKRWEQIKALVEEGKGLSHVRTTDESEDEIAGGDLEAEKEAHDYSNAGASNISHPISQPHNDISEQTEHLQDEEPGIDETQSIIEEDELEDEESYAPDSTKQTEQGENPEEESGDLGISAEDFEEPPNEVVATKALTPKSSTDSSTLEGDYETTRKSDTVRSVEPEDSNNDRTGILAGARASDGPSRPEEIGQEEEEFFVDQAVKYNDSAESVRHPDTTNLESDIREVDYSADYDEIEPLETEETNIPDSVEKDDARHYEDSERHLIGQAYETSDHYVDLPGSKGETDTTLAEASGVPGQAGGDQLESFASKLGNITSIVPDADVAISKEGPTPFDDTNDQVLVLENEESVEADDYDRPNSTGDDFLEEFLEDDTHQYEELDPTEASSNHQFPSPKSLKRRRSDADNVDLEYPSDQETKRSRAS